MDHIAERICHLAWVSYQLGCGQDYNAEPDQDDLASNSQAIDALRANPHMTPEQNHDNWMAIRLSQGWVYGPVRDEAAKTHPDLVPFSELPEVERRKDIMDLIGRRLALEVSAMITDLQESLVAAHQGRDTWMIRAEAHRQAKEFAEQALAEIAVRDSGLEHRLDEWKATARNYARSAEYWRSLYEQAPVAVEVIS